MGFTVLYTDSRAKELDVEREIIRPDALLVHAQKTSLDDVDPGALEACDAIVVNRLRIDATVVARLKRCRLVVRNGVGYDVLDLEALGKAGIAACNVPDYGTTEVSDSAIAMMLAFARGTLAYDAALRADLKTGWTHVHNPASRRLRGATFGLIGMGRIGTASGLRARAFGMNVAFYDPYLRNGTELALGFTRAKTLHELLGMADVVCIHAELTRENRGMINGDAVAAMKHGRVRDQHRPRPDLRHSGAPRGAEERQASRGGSGRAAERAGRHGRSARRGVARQRALAARPRDTRPARRLLQPGRLRGPAREVRGDRDRLPARREAAELRQYGISQAKAIEVMTSGDGELVTLLRSLLG